MSPSAAGPNALRLALPSELLLLPAGLEIRRGRLRSEPGAENFLELARLDYLACAFDDAIEHGAEAFRQFRRGGDPQQAALAACVVGKAYQEGLDNRAAARGWFARGRTLLDGLPECVEQGWVDLALIGCEVDDAAELEERARSALALARRLGSDDLEAKSLADLGLALISAGRTRSGMEMIDEALAIVSSGELERWTAGHVACSALTACQRAGDGARADAWLEIVDRPEMSPAIFSHCHITCGTLLLESGRWREAEVALRVGLAAGRDRYFHLRVAASAGLAELRVRQGRLDQAAQLLAGWPERLEAMPATIRLHQARGEHELAVAVARGALNRLGQDRARAFPVLLLLVDSEIARGDLEAAKAAAGQASETAAAMAAPSLSARAALARARLARAEGQAEVARNELETAVGALPEGEPAPLFAMLHLELAETRAGTDRAAAITDARVALELFGRSGSPEAARCAALLRRLGVDTRMPATESTDPLATLSPREREVAALLGQGCSNRQIGERLAISAKTAEHHVCSIISKLGLHSRYEVAALQA